MRFNENNKARILIVDDHSIVRQGIAMLINREPELHACCEADSVPQAITANRACPHDLAIVDLSLGGGSGMELIKKLRAEFPELRILMMSMHDESVYAEPALRAGAHGYLMKQAATDTMLQAIRQILEGEMYVSVSMRSRLIQQMMGGRQPQESPLSNLTQSEIEILHLIGMGMGTSEISAKLNRSVKTVETHRANIKRKLNLNSGNELAHFAITLASSSAIKNEPGTV